MLHASPSASGSRRVLFVVKNILIYYQVITCGHVKNKFKMIKMSTVAEAGIQDWVYMRITETEQSSHIKDRAS